MGWVDDGGHNRREGREIEAINVQEGRGGGTLGHCKIERIAK